MARRACASPRCVCGVGVVGQGATMKTNLGDIGNKAKRTELYRKQKGDKKAQQKERRRRREREAQELGEVSLVGVSALMWLVMKVFTLSTLVRCGLLCGCCVLFTQQQLGRCVCCVLVFMFCHRQREQARLSVTWSLVRMRGGNQPGTSGPLACVCQLFRTLLCTPTRTLKGTATKCAPLTVSLRATSLRLPFG